MLDNMFNKNFLKDNVLLDIQNKEIISEDSLLNIYQEVFSLRKQQFLSYIDKNESSQWENVIDVCSKILSSKTKDLYVAIWMWEALGRKYGVEGFIEGANILTSLCIKYKNILSPFDVETRQNCAKWVNEKIKISLMELKIFGNFSLCDHLRNDINNNIVKEENRLQLQNNKNLLETSLKTLEILSSSLKEIFESRSWELTKLKDFLKESIIIFQQYIDVLNSKLHRKETVEINNTNNKEETMLNIHSIRTQMMSMTDEEKTELLKLMTPEDNK
jgi:hypothetical protein